MGYNISIKWLRKRHTFSWDKITVTLDYTKGYGYIIELEKLTDENQKDSVLEELKQRLSELNILLTPREDFDKSYQNYKDNWQSLILVP